MLRQESAETIALQALGWLAGHEELLPTFLATTGAAVGDLAKAAGDPAFLGSVLDFLLLDDAWVMEFCRAHDLRFEVPMQARASLPGGEAINWT